MIDIDVNDIEIVQGNTAEIDITPLEDDSVDTPVIMQDGDKVIFTVALGRKTYIRKELTAAKQNKDGSLTLTLSPEDTINMPPIDYEYDCLFIFADGSSYTFIQKAKFTVDKAISKKGDVT